MRKFSTLLILIIVGWCSGIAKSSPFILKNDGIVRISCHGEQQPILKTSLGVFAKDIATVLGDSVIYVGSGMNIDIFSGIESIPSDLSDPERNFLTGHKEGFILKVLPSGKLIIVGSDSHGTAYGILELSRLMGVSPWEWWADATPEKIESFSLPADFITLQAPSVEYRGIFINDEDWGLMPWSSTTLEPENERGIIGNETTRRIFELLLRLRANTYWPPMHECTLPFFLTEGNREIAKEYGIYIGSSHCEPMACNAAGEWHRRGKGDYDYVNNSANVLNFWESRVKDVANQEMIYTIGMRGVHDGSMQGAKTVEEQKNVLTRVFNDQRNLLGKYVNRDVPSVPQVFIPYKEVLDIYNAGLEVPDDVTLMWCDDNYGYIRHFPTKEERIRKGGNGIYYHVSYWGRPHDYLWLGTVSPWLISQQMNEAYDRGIRKMWILNVGDIKPSEYQIELFMDMAWNIDSVRNCGIDSHLTSFLKREFGDRHCYELSRIMKEHYRLAFIRKPEFLGNTRVEEWGNDKWNHISDLPWSDSYIIKRLERYSRLSDDVENVFKYVPDNRRDTYFQLVKYPVQASAEMNKKLLSAQLARHRKADWHKTSEAYDSIVSLTKIYNQGYANNGKWNGIMDFRPRELPVFNQVPTNIVTKSPNEHKYIAILNGIDFSKGNPVILSGLGYEGKAIGIQKDESVSYSFECDSNMVDITLKMLPNHPIEAGAGLKIAVTADNCEPVIFDYSTQGRSEEWKVNVLNNQATRKVSFRLEHPGIHKLSVKALTEGVILDQILVNH